MRKLLNQFKEKLYIDDLKKVLLYGSLNMLIFSVLAGALQFVAYNFLGLGFGLLIYLFAYMIGKEIKERINNYHIWYSTIGVLFFFVGLILYNVTLWSFTTHNISLGFNLIFSSYGLRYVVFEFLNYHTYQGINILYNILDIILISFCIISVWRMPESKK